VVPVIDVPDLTSGALKLDGDVLADVFGPASLCPPLPG